MKKKTDIKDFWNNKIIKWENSRYFKNDGNFFEKFISHFSNSLFERQKVCLELLSRIVKNRSVIEIGCGSGILCKKVLSLGASSYYGIDFAENAINRAKELNSNEIQTNKARFETLSVSEIDKIIEEVIFSCGLIDWISQDELYRLSNFSKNKYFIHSYSKEDNSFYQYLHKKYVYLAYKKKTNFHPKYYSREKITKMFKRVNFYKNYKLSFGEFFFNFDI